MLAVVVALVVIGLGLLAFTAWFWRNTRPEPGALAPLELLSTRKVRRADPERQRKALAAVRPGEVEPAPVEAVSYPDLAELASRELPSIDELAEPQQTVGDADRPGGADDGSSAAVSDPQPSPERAAPEQAPPADELPEPQLPEPQLPAPQLDPPGSPAASESRG